VLLVRQFRPPIREVLTEIPAGTLDVDGEDALTCAARELFEEPGFHHETIEFLGGFYSSVGWSDEYVHLFVARTAGEADGNPEPGIEVVREPLERLVAAQWHGSRREDGDGAVALRGARAACVTVTASAVNGSGRLAGEPLHGEGGE
jgi:ADP-ribose pyrophosphatase